MASLTMKATITRTEAERRITDYQREILRDYGCRSTWELYAQHGALHCCGGPFTRTDTELRERYRGLVPDIDALDGEALVQAIIAFEQEQAPERDCITCNAVGHSARLCDGLAHYTNVELGQWFSAALNARAVVDD